MCFVVLGCCEGVDFGEGEGGVGFYYWWRVGVILGCSGVWVDDWGSNYGFVVWGWWWYKCRWSD